MRHGSNRRGIILESMLRRSLPISWFVICWTLLFQYETLRANYLSPLFKRELPKTALLFPPAGWIMFFNVDRSYGFAEVYGVLPNSQPVTLDPHEMFRTKAVGYDNIHRNVLVGVLSQSAARPFCRYLHWKFPAYTSFAVLYGQYPDVADHPDLVQYRVAYRCQ